jgi:hypothetical protein
MEINGEKVIGYDRVADRGIVVSTQSVNHAMGDCTQVFMTFDNKADADIYQAVVHAVWNKHIKSLREGYITIVK